MSDKRAALTGKLEAITARLAAKTAKLSESRAELRRVNEDLASEKDAIKWEDLVTLHGVAANRVAALADETAVLAEWKRDAALEVNDFDSTMAAAELTAFLAESTRIRTRSAELRDEHRRVMGILKVRISDPDARKRNEAIGLEIAQLEFSAGTNRRDVEHAKFKCARLAEERREIEAVN